MGYGWYDFGVDPNQTAQSGVTNALKGVDDAGAGQIPSVYQPTTVGLNVPDPVTAPGGAFYDPYAQIDTAVTPKTDPWAQDFKATVDASLKAASDVDIAKFDPTPDSPLTVTDLYAPTGTIGGKERIEPMGVGPKEKVPLVEVTPIMNKEIEKINEIAAQVQDKEHTKLPQSVVDHKTGDVLVSSVEDDAPTIEVPISAAMYETGGKMNPGFSLRWLYELVKLLALKGYRVVFRSA